MEFHPRVTLRFSKSSSDLTPPQQQSCGGIPVASRIPPRAGVKTTSDKEERFSQKGDGEEAVHERRGSTKEAQYIMMATEKKPPDMQNDLYKTRRRTRIDRIRM